MKKVLLPVAGIAVMLTMGCKQNGEMPKQDLLNARDSFSYSIGLSVSSSFANFKDELDLPALFAGISDGVNDREPKLDETASRAAQAGVFERLSKEAEEKRKTATVENKKIGDEFLAKNKEKPGVIVTESGLQYEVVTAGTGTKPTGSDMVEVHYVGTLLDGKEFDSSRKRNEPAKFRVGGVIKGWQEGLLLMPVGSTYRLYVPSDLAYGERGASDAVPPNSVLIFEVELLAIDAPEATKPSVEKK